MSTHSASPAPAPARTETRADWLRLTLGVAAVFGVFHASATALGSDRGQRGVLVGSLVVAATAAAEWLLHGRDGSAAPRLLGLGRPRLTGMATAAAAALLLLLAGLLFLRARAISVSLYPGWISLLPGLFAQGGIAEEVLFRAYLFGHVRAGRTFWGAAALSMLPFVGVHLVLFFSMPWPVALAAVLLASVISFPLAHLFELGAGSIWAPALLHFVIQATPKVLVVSHGGESFALAWILASAVVPLLVFAVRIPERPGRVPGN